MPNQEGQQTVIAGAGPAGLTAAWMLARRGVRPLVLEQDDQVGGLARTVEYKGFRFDIGGHRFFTKVGAVQKLWRIDAGHRDAAASPPVADLLRRQVLRLPPQADERPLRPRRRQRPPGPPELLWIGSSPFDRRSASKTGSPTASAAASIDIFFKTYTEKVWGIPCNRIGAQWAAQRIKGLSLFTAITNMLLQGVPQPGAKQIKTLIDEFEYPRLGPGMMWEAFQRRGRAHGRHASS